MRSLPIKQSILIALEVKTLKIIEFFRFDSKIASSFLFFIYITEYYYLKYLRNDFRSLAVAGKIFRHIPINWCRDYATNILKSYANKYPPNILAERFFSLCNIDKSKAAKLKQSILTDRRPFDRRLIILSQPHGDERGVIVIKFTEYFKYLRAIFNLDRLARDYMLVLEPSSCGYFDEDILCLMGNSTPLIVQAQEPVDYCFLESVNTNLIPVDLGANCWVDKRTFFPRKGIDKRYDIIMVGIWANVKRHYHLFEALSRSKRKDSIRVALVGVPWPRSLDEIRDLAKHYEVDRCIEYFENISQDVINVLLNKSKLCLLLSKKEGFNKSIVEAMHADVPSFLLSGYNFGHRYSYLNARTGGFIDGSKLAEFIDNIDIMLEQGSFSPSEWVAKYMCAETATAKLEQALNSVESRGGVRVNKRLEIKINNPNCDYLNADNWDRYAKFYKDLRKYFRED